MLLLPNTSLENAKIMGQRIVSEIQKKTFDYEGIKLKVTVSVGVVVSRTYGHKDTLIEYADRALYEAKRNGRNQSVIYVDRLKKVDLFMSEKTLVDVSEEHLRRRAEQYRGSL